MYHTHEITHLLQHRAGATAGEQHPSSAWNTQDTLLSRVPPVWRWSLHRLVASSDVPLDALCELLFPRSPTSLRIYTLKTLLSLEAEGQCYVSAPSAAWYPFTLCQDGATESDRTLDLLLANIYYLPFGIPERYLADPAAWGASYAASPPQDPSAGPHSSDAQSPGATHRSMPLVASIEPDAGSEWRRLWECQEQTRMGALDVSRLVVVTFASDDHTASPNAFVSLNSFARSLQALH